jgi:hypothetical protein
VGGRKNRRNRENGEKEYKEEIYSTAEITPFNSSGYCIIQT